MIVVEIDRSTAVLILRMISSAQGVADGEGAFFQFIGQIMVPVDPGW
jgi:hypothetical protein